MFDYPGKNDYSRLYRVFEYSANLQGFDVTLITIPAPRKKRSASYDANTAKLNVWHDYLKKTASDKVIFMDCDMMVTGDMSTAFDSEFDIAYTYRMTRVPFNGGVIFVRNNRWARDTIKQWAQVNKQMHNDTEFHNQWRSKYAGINQSAFGYLLEQGDIDCHIEALPCYLYNACDETWRNLHPETKAIHYKSELRRAALGIRFAPWLDHLVQKWQAMEKEITNRGNNPVGRKGKAKERQEAYL